MEERKEVTSGGAHTPIDLFGSHPVECRGEREKDQMDKEGQEIIIGDCQDVVPLSCIRRVSSFGRKLTANTR